MLENKMKKELKYIYQVQKEISILSGISALLGWDQETHMPKKGSENRAEQEVMIQNLIYSKITSEKLWKAINYLKKQKLSEKDKIVLRELEKDVSRARKIPREFVEKFSKEIVKANSLWQKARKENDFEIFKPSLKNLVKLSQKKAHYLNPKVEPYDALLDIFEEGMTSEKLTKLFSTLKEELVNLLEKIKKSKKYKNQSKANFKMSKEKQEKISKDIVQKMGISFDEVCYDVSPHPFTTTIGKNDVRITSRYENAFESFFSTVHEAGHALYELGLPKEFENTFVKDAPSLGIHESQSRFWENMIAKSKSFWKGYFRFYKKNLKEKINLQDFYEKINRVKPSYIRVNADEVTYCLHVILRFEIERDLINGKIKVEDVRDIWNKKFEEMFGIKVPDDNSGALQDIHWAHGSFGYFPTYAIGTIYSSQILKKLKEVFPNFDELVRNQKFNGILKWLRENIHSKGRTMLADEIIRNACESGLNPKVFIKYLTDKYSKIYKF